MSIFSDTAGIARRNSENRSHVTTEQVKEDHELPSAFEDPQHILDAFRGGCGRMFLLTFR